MKRRLGGLEGSAEWPPGRQNLLGNAEGWWMVRLFLQQNVDATPLAQLNCRYGYLIWDQ
jgi:hypothetical protein